jgi:uncharacterized protein
MIIDFEQLWQTVENQFQMHVHSIHGPTHWKRVERNGLLLASRTGADVIIVRLFAIFHDSRRLDDGWDKGHGARGAEYAEKLRPILPGISDENFEKLHYACTWHADGASSDDVTIGTCWDADRLDLGRVGVIPSAEFMSTAFAREIADYGSIQPFVKAWNPES